MELEQRAVLLLVDPSTLMPLLEVPLESGPAHTAYLWFDQLLAVAGTGARHLALVDLERMEPHAELTFEQPVQGLAGGASGDRLFVFLGNPAAMRTIRLPDLVPLASTPLPEEALMVVTSGSASFCG